MITDYHQAVEFLYKNLPMFQRIGAAALKRDLSNTVALCRAFGDPQHKFKSIHVAGTNGKGSTSHMLAAVLQSAGYRTGLYTSPHLKDFTERIRLDGAPIEKKFVIDFVNRVIPLIEQIKPSFFEITVAMAFEYFAFNKVDVAVIETGLGGRLDSTNVIHPCLSIITNIGHDHADILGNTLQKIATEKAGIIKPSVPVVISERQEEVASIFEHTALAERAPVYFATDHYVARKGMRGIDVSNDNTIMVDSLAMSLTGNYQLKNMAGVFMALEQIQNLGFTISEQSIRTGLEQVISLTGLKGRWQKLRDSPLMICDTGHNEEGIREVVNQIREYTYKKLHMVIGMVKDKDLTHVLSLLPVDAKYYFCEAKIPRALEARLLKEKAEMYGLQGEVIKDVNQAIKTALDNASANDFIFIGGSSFVVAEINDL